MKFLFMLPVMSFLTVEAHAQEQTGGLAGIVRDALNEAAEDGLIAESEASELAAGYDVGQDFFREVFLNLQTATIAIPSNIRRAAAGLVSILEGGFSDLNNQLPTGDSVSTWTQLATTEIDNDPSITSQLAEALEIESAEMHSRFFYTELEALGFLYFYLDGSAGNFGLAVAHFNYNGQTYDQPRVVSSLFGTSPRDVVFGENYISVTTTMLASGDARCCPSGSAVWRVDRDTFVAVEE